jgi:hypothetical protein
LVRTGNSKFETRSSKQITSTNGANGQTREQKANPKHETCLPVGMTRNAKQIQGTNGANGQTVKRMANHKQQIANKSKAPMFKSSFVTHQSSIADRQAQSAIGKRAGELATMRPIFIIENL